tara:strand:+ start:246 stop:497 length:252 start_codon:yes stop_codon:yes gene_type:complete
MVRLLTDLVAAEDRLMELAELAVMVAAVLLLTDLVLLEHQELLIQVAVVEALTLLVVAHELVAVEVQDKLLYVTNIKTNLHTF